MDATWTPSRPHCTSRVTISSPTVLELGRGGRGLGPHQESDAEVITLVVMQALLGFTSEARWLRDARAQSGPDDSLPAWAVGVQKRLRAVRYAEVADRVPGRANQHLDR